MALALDRKAFIAILADGKADDRRRHAAAARRESGACRDCCKTLPGYDPDVEKNQPKPRQIMESLGYSEASRSR